MTDAQALFKGMNLSQAQAQSMVDFHAAQMQAALKAPYDAVAEVKNKWEGEAKAHFGKDIEPGGKTNVAISRLIDTLPPGDATAFREALNHTLAGSNPAVLKALAAFADRFGEGTSVRGGNPSPLGQRGPNQSEGKTIAERMYPHLPTQNR